SEQMHSMVMKAARYCRANLRHSSRTEAEPEKTISFGSRAFSRSPTMLDVGNLYPSDAAHIRPTKTQVQLRQLFASGYHACAALYSSSVTCSPQVAALPSSSTSTIARWVMKRLGPAPCQWSSPGSKKTRSPGRMTTL